MNGVLLIDKPQGPTSHDVVARIRAVSREKRVGHTGTLDPLATGLLPLVLGRATRLSSFLMGQDKTYAAVVRLGQSTSTDDAAGEPLGARSARLPARVDVEEALAGFRGAFEQVPPRHSAKRVDGQKAYDLARQDKPVLLAPVPVVVERLEIRAVDGPDVHLDVVASSGFYVRALARDLGERLGCGAHLVSLCRTAVGAFALERAVALDEAERLGPHLSARLISPSDAMGHLEHATVTEAGRKRALHGNPLAPEHLVGRFVPSGRAAPVRVLGPDGELLALAHARGGALHPVVVLS
jgi:tRNA pseudouridine55 synthase